MNISSITIILTFVVAIIKGVYLVKLSLYLKENHFSVWKEITPKRFLWFSSDDFPFGNYFKQIKFILSYENYSDKELRNLKNKIRIYFFLFWLLVLLDIIVIG
jgi:hypothetical protein